MDDNKPKAIDPIQESSQVTLEALVISTTESAAVVNDSNTLECIAKNYEQYVQHYQDAWQSAWLDTMSQFDNDVERWQSALKTLQSQTQNPEQAKNQQSSEQLSASPEKAEAEIKAKRPAPRTATKSPKSGKQ